MPVHANPLYLLGPATPTPEVTEAVSNFHQGWLPLHELEDGQLLHHYTDLEGLQGILKTRSLRFGHINTLNDPQEIKHGQQVVFDQLNHAIDQEDDQWIRHFLSQVRAMVTGSTRDLHHGFVACFCEDGGLLSQWRGYADRGGGYSLGFEISENTSLAPCGINERKPLFLRKVIYSPITQNMVVGDYLNAIRQAAESVQPRGDLGDASIMAIQAANPLIDMVYCFKNPAFSEEKEWRMIRATMENQEPENVEFRSVDSRLRPFRPMHVFDSVGDSRVIPLREVHFGPSLDPSSTAPAIKLLMRTESSKDHPIQIEPNGIRVIEPGFSLR
jgi:hypothetical protein